MTTTTTTAPNTAETIAQQTVCIDLSISRPGTRRRVDSGVVNKTDAEDERVHVSKEVLKSEKLDAVNKVTSKVRTYMKAVMLPMSIYRPGLYPISIARIEDVPARLDEFKASFDKAVKEFIDEYAPADGSESAIIKADREALKSLFETGDYPSREEMKRRFAFEYYIVTQKTPEAMKALHPAMFKKEQKRAEERLRAAADELVAGLRVRFRDLVTHMVDQLKPNAVGQRKKFYTSKVERLSEFLKNLGGDNVLGDVEIAGLATKASKLLEGLDAEALREDDDYQQKVLNDFDGLKTSLDALAGDAERTFDFGKEA